ncbi:hypothetical protein [Comamonas sp. 4034]|uniref:hypothetical protein n=1 Tax=Comamonas sp. 4034 TaxID=3156455 RepID=UPI003D1D8B92
MPANTKPVASPFPPLEQETRPCVPTAQAAHYLMLAPQTLREWACYGKYPAALRPVRVGSRLAWPVSGIRAVLGLPCSSEGA